MEMVGRLGAPRCGNDGVLGCTYGEYSPHLPSWVPGQG